MRKFLEDPTNQDTTYAQTLEPTATAFHPVHLGALIPALFASGEPSCKALPEIENEYRASLLKCPVQHAQAAGSRSALTRH
eukprot:3419051-Rhodomonas_salina.2